jgi:NAD(P)-dependent dehydrogenase (short-subunit alcohol dehydrogenase family)
MAERRRFEGRVALVTGGASGIGLAISRRLAREGASLALADVNEASLAAALAALGDTIECCLADVRVEAQLEAAVDATVRRFGGLDVAFNCAGLSAPAPIVEAGGRISRSTSA